MGKKLTPHRLEKLLILQAQCILALSGNVKPTSWRFSFLCGHTIDSYEGSVDGTARLLLVGL